MVLSEVRQKDKYHIMCMWNLKINTSELIYNINGLTDIENKFMDTKGEGERVN